ncbi:hypothetical protein [Flavobacterium sp. HSC-61S13]|uniref:hypothetical protein n=1 Tax=Flavobacterium sp. HSC-61S13 TaxID=2910963 RepID=UPI00209F0D06|nr:hypothetical protein [Flavobacterium sp. HSC-61S13]MCP1996284.1 hypothetical protein [Flavobacterium sp. HSC-61S13]
MNMTKLAVYTIVLLLVVAMILLSIPDLDKECVRDLVILPACIIASRLLLVKSRKR